MADFGFQGFPARPDDMATYRRFIEEVVPIVRLAPLSTTGTEA